MNGTAPGLRGMFDLARKEADFHDRPDFEVARRKRTAMRDAATSCSP